MIRTALMGLMALSSPIVFSAKPAIAQTKAAAPATVDEALVAIDADFARWMQESNVPGLVWGVVRDGKLIHLRSMGIKDIDSKPPVTGDTAFRIASMSKAFTGYAILKLRDEGKLRLDDPVWKHVPEVQKWGEDITIADLLSHTAGFVTDDPWGDRQQPMPEAEFTALLSKGVPRNTARGTRFEYSNFGYALLGRIISNSAKVNFSKYVEGRVLQPLGMNTTTYEVGKVPAATLAIGYRWEEGAWLREPTMAHGAFGSMGGVVTTGNDYAKWISFLLSGMATPAGGSVNNKTVWEMQRGSGFPQARRRPGKSASECKVSAVYAAGLLAGNDCVLGNVLFHGGGFPGYGSHMLLIPETGAGIFALSNRTYAGPSGPVWDAATALVKAGFLTRRPSSPSASLDTAYANAKSLWSNGNFKSLNDKGFAMNFFMDRSKLLWEKRLGEWKAQVGSCDTGSPLVANGNLSASFEWSCQKGKIKGSLLLAPTFETQIQSLSYDIAQQP
jgi:serine-type D-Ala-D-Ala carboxypeptidase/endopeptidase